MAAPKADPARCDVNGCGMIATSCTDGTEADTHPKPSPDGKPRKALPFVNVCDRHVNYPFSDDARAWAAGAGAGIYKNRKGS